MTSKTDAPARARAFYDRFSQTFLDCAGPTFQAALWRPDASTLEDAVASNVYLALQAGIRPGDRVLDGGCGVCGPAVDIAQAIDGVTIDGVTVSPVQVGIGRRRVADAGLADRVTVHEADFHALPFEDDRFDVAVFFEAAVYAPDPARLLAEVRRVLRPGGRLYLKEVLRKGHALSDQEQADFDVYCDLWGLVGTPSLDELCAAVRDAGFRLEQARSLDDVAGTDHFYGSMVDFSLDRAPDLNAFGQHFFKPFARLPIHFADIRAVAPA